MIAIAALQLFSVLLIGGFGVIWGVTNLIMAWNPDMKRDTKSILANHAVAAALIAFAWSLVLLYGWVPIG